MAVTDQEHVQHQSRIARLEAMARQLQGSTRLMASAPVTSLPPAPFDGQEIYYRFQQTVNPTDATLLIWHLRWDAAGGYWVPVGEQPPIYAIDGFQRSTSFSANTWGGVDPADPTLNVPRAGEYRLEWGNNNMLSPAGSNCWVGLQLAGADPGVGGPLTCSGGYTTGQWLGGAPGSARASLVAGALVRMRYMTQNIAGPISRITAYVKAYPRRITG